MLNNITNSLFEIGQSLGSTLEVTPWSLLLLRSYCNTLLQIKDLGTLRSLLNTIVNTINTNMANRMAESKISFTSPEVIMIRLRELGTLIQNSLQQTTDPKLQQITNCDRDQQVTQIKNRQPRRQIWCCHAYCFILFAMLFSSIITYTCNGYIEDGRTILSRWLCNQHD